MAIGESIDKVQPVAGDPDRPAPDDEPGNHPDVGDHGVVNHGPTGTGAASDRNDGPGVDADSHVPYVDDQDPSVELRDPRVEVHGAVVDHHDPSVEDKEPGGDHHDPSVDHQDPVGGDHQDPSVDHRDPRVDHHDVHDAVVENQDPSGGGDNQGEVSSKDILLSSASGIEEKEEVEERKEKGEEERMSLMEGEKKSLEEKRIRFDDILEDLGDFGRYQKIIYFLLFLPTIFRQEQRPWIIRIAATVARSF